MMLVAVIMLLVSSRAAAQEDFIVPVHLSDAVDLALRERPEQRQAMEKENMALSKVNEARGNFLPTLDLSASSDYIKNFDTFTGIDISAEIAGQEVLVNIEKEVPAYELNGALDLVYNLYAGGRDSALLGEALSRLDAVGHQEEITRRKIRLEVANAYWGLKKAQMEYLMARRALGVVRMEMQVAQTEHRVHRASDVAYEAVLLKGSEKQVALRTADRQCLRAYGSYLHVLGLPEETAIPSSEQLPGLADEPGDPAGIDPAPAVHPEILQLKSDLRAAAERERAAKAGNLPKLDFFAKYALIGRDPDTYLDAWRDAQSEYYMVGLKVTMNLFNGGRTRERIQQAATEQRIKRLELMEKERALAQERRARQTALETARDQLSLAVARMKLERARQQAAAAGFKAGRISRLEYRQKMAAAQDAADKATIAKIDVTLAQNELALMVLSP
jgi:outer membrane protein, multidrug efflux system